MAIACSIAQTRIAAAGLRHSRGPKPGISTSIIPRDIYIRKH